MHASLSDRGFFRLCAHFLGGALLSLQAAPSHGQALVRADSFHGGILVENFSLGTSATGDGWFAMPIPTGSTIRHATLYGIEVGGHVAPTTVRVNDVDHVFDTNTMTAFTYVAPPYGTVQLHALDLTDVVTPDDTEFVISVPGSQATINRFVDFTLMIAYERAGDAMIWTDLFWCDANSAPTESYTVTTSAPMRNTAGVAFATMASYCDVGFFDCERITVNGMQLGTFGGMDANAMSTFGTTASLKYSADEFIGFEDDDADLAIAGADVLSDISTLITNGATTFNVTYTHCPSGSPDDNLMNLMLVAYAAEPCAYTVDLGPDTTLCPGASLLLNATVPNATYTWQDGSTTASYAVTTAGTYHVTVQLPGCDLITDTVVVSAIAVPPFDLGPDRTICPDEVITLYVQPVQGAKYNWDDGVVGPARDVSAAGSFQLTVSIEGCVFRSTVEVVADSCLQAIELPNIFTPNGDGVNHEFGALSMHGVRTMEVTIYNRWGQLVYRSTNPGFRWDGRTAAGSPVPDGTYFWVLTHTLEKDPTAEHSLTGTVTLTR